MFVQPIQCIEVDNDDTCVLQNDARKKLKELVPKEIESTPIKQKYEVNLLTLNQMLSQAQLLLYRRN